MFDTQLAVIGTVATSPHMRAVNGRSVLSFRLASTARRLNKTTNEWEDGNSLFLTVNCWGKIADRSVGVIAKGDPLIVVGEVYTSEYTDREGTRRSTLEMRAAAIGPDTSRCDVALARPEPVAA